MKTDIDRIDIDRLNGIAVSVCTQQWCRPGKMMKKIEMMTMIPSCTGKMAGTGKSKKVVQSPGSST